MKGFGAVMSVTKIESRWGPIEYYSKDEYVGKSLWNYGEYNPDETEKILGLASVSNGLCLDIGANFGVMGMALEKNGFEVVSFEPQPEIYKLLSRNVSGQVWNCALGATAGVAQMGKLRYTERNNFGGLGIGTVSPFGTIDVEVRTLDSFEYNNVGFMKIDVEGFEEQVLIGGTETINRCHPIMYIEDDRADRSASLRRKIRSLGYSIEEHKPLLYRENNFFGKKKNVWAPYNYASHNLICRPC